MGSDAKCIIFSSSDDPRKLLPSVISSAFHFPIIFESPQQVSVNKFPLYGDPFAFRASGSFELNDEISICRYIIAFASEKDAKSVGGINSVAFSEFSENYGEIEQCIEWLEKNFKSNVYSFLKGEKDISQEIIEKIESKLGENEFILGKKLSFADLVLWYYCSLLFQNENSILNSSLLTAWFGKIGKIDFVSNGIKSAFGNNGINNMNKERLISKPEPKPETKSEPKSEPKPEPKPETKSESKFEPDSAMPKLPVPGNRNILITSALPYVNNVPHLGNIIGCVLSADVFARYCRNRKYNTIYMCGTDEYGTATENKALEEKLTPKQICDKYHAIHKEIYEWFDISFDKFGRTSTQKQTEICQSIFLSLLSKNCLIEDTMEQLYCTTCERFLADRFVEGICPNCAYDDARGDQCDKCGKLLNPTELVKPRCKVCKNAPEVRKTDHLFLDLPKIKDRLEEYVGSTSVGGNWSTNSMQITQSWLRDGLKPRCITRDLKWGVPVPLEKFKDKVFYVWFDAPIGYLSITANYTDDWKKWWKNPADVELFQFMGKDNVPFHTVIFPSTLLGTEDDWTLMKHISVTEYLNYEDGKFSKSRGIGVFGNDAKTTNIPTEIWRYYLLTNRPEASDTFFTWSDLQAKQNNELLKNLGNFIHRCLAFIAKTDGQGFDSQIPSIDGVEIDEITKDYSKKIGDLVIEYIDNMEKVKLKAALKMAMAISTLGNGYLQDSRFWKLFKEEKSKCALVLKCSAGIVYILALLLEPFMPSFTQKVLSQLNLPRDSLDLSEGENKIEKFYQPWQILASGHTIGNPEPIFSEMSDAEVEFYRNKFAGSQADRSNNEPDKSPAAATVADSKPKGQVQEKSLENKGESKKDGNSEKKKKTEKEKSSKSGDKNSVANSESSSVDFARLDVRVGQIKSIKRHPDADSLYVEEIDLGEKDPRTVVSGLVKFIPIEKMQNRKVCVLCNLKPASMRGVKSFAMVLAASNGDHTQVELLNPPEDAEVGDKVFVPGFSGDSDVQLNPKKKIWESVQVDLKTNEERVACYKSFPLSTKTGVCTVESLQACSIG